MPERAGNRVKKGYRAPGAAVSSRRIHAGFRNEDAAGMPAPSRPPVQDGWQRRRTRPGRGVAARPPLGILIVRVQATERIFLNVRWR